MADLLYTHSASADFRACRYKYALSNRCGVRGRVPAYPLRLGTLVHGSLEPMWLARMAGKSWDEAYEAGRSVIDAPNIGFDDFERARLRVTLSVDVEIWRTVDCHVLAVEAKFVAPMYHPERRGRDGKLIIHPRFQRAGKIDLILRLGDGRIAVVEHKTSAADIEPGSDYRRKLTLDAQVSQYYAGAISLGFKPDVVIYHVLRKFDEKPRKMTPVDKRIYVTDKKTKVKRLKSGQREHDETPDEYEARLAAVAAADPNACVERIEIHRLPKERQRYALQVWQQADDMAHAIDADLMYQNPDSCLRYGSPCEYLPHCAEGARLDDPIHFRKVGAHVELAEEPTAATTHQQAL